MDKKILVLGGAGFIGSHMVDVLCRQGAEVHILDNLSLGRREYVENWLKQGQAFLHVADASVEGSIARVLGECGPFDLAIHLAANSDIQKSAKDPEIEYHHTFMTTWRLLEALRTSSCRKLLFASTSAIYGDRQNQKVREDSGPNQPISYYGGAKLASEAFISSYSWMNNMQTWICRFPNVVGGRSTHGVIHDFIKRLRIEPGRLQVLGDGTQCKPYLHVKDLVQAMWFIRNNAKNDYNVYNIGVDSQTSVSTIARIVLEEMGLEQTRLEYSGGTIGWKGDVPKFSYDNHRLQDLGWRPTLDSDQAVRQAVKDVLAEG